MMKNGHSDHAFQRADGWCESVCKSYVLSLLSRSPEIRFWCIGCPVYATSVHRGCSISKTKALMKKESTTNFQRVGDGVIPIRQRIHPITSEPKTERYRVGSSVTATLVHRTCWSSKWRFKRNLSGTAGTEFVFRLVSKFSLRRVLFFIFLSDFF